MSPFRYLQEKYKVPNPATRPMDLTYFTLCSNVFTKIGDCRDPAKSLTLKFYLRLPQSLTPSILVSTATSLKIHPPPLIPSLLQTVANLEFTLGNLSDDILSGITPEELRNLVIIVRDTITISPYILLPYV